VPKNMKRREDFQFKKFRVAHDRSTHKIGTDGVLLGAWVNTQDAHTILDIGTGTGVIALMLAQRTPERTRVDAVEMEKEDAAQAMENVVQSPWPQKINVFHSSIQKFTPAHLYDLIVSNPPYFINSWLPPDDKRSHARHTIELSFEELLQFASRWLKEDGRLSVILPYQEGLQFIDLAGNYDLRTGRELLFRSRHSKPVERILIELSKQAIKTIPEELVLYRDGEEWSEEYKKLTRDFYLNA
jgi:tRNA1Val (adenine37-N6)-methyltransferase